MSNKRKGNPYSKFFSCQFKASSLMKCRTYLTSTLLLWCSIDCLPPSESLWQVWSTHPNIIPHMEIPKGCEVGYHNNKSEFRVLTVDRLYSGHALQRTPLYSGHHFWETISNILLKFTSTQRTPLYNGHIFREAMVSAIGRFHCN